MSYALAASLATLRQRAAMLAAIRAFFAARGVLEVETPALTRAGVTDPAIESITATGALRPSRQGQGWSRIHPRLRRIAVAGISGGHPSGNVRQFTLLRGHWPVSRCLSDRKPQNRFEHATKQP
jgi:hypothetical protein